MLTIAARGPLSRVQLTKLQEALDARAAAGLLRRRRIVEQAEGPRLIVDGKELLAFCSNDYLGLAHHPEVSLAFADAARSLGTGAGSAHLITGHHRAHHQLEEALAAFTGRDRALLFSTGYMANLGIGAAFAGRGAWVLEDRLNHASLLDAAGRARLKRYTHKDVDSARTLLESAVTRPALVMTDGVFSMDGDIAPVQALAGLCREFQVPLVVDDAHGLGVLGATGAGTLEQAGLGQNDVPLLMGTLGKAFGVFGAFVAGPAVVIETLIQHARTYIYTTAMPPALATATLASLNVLKTEPWRRERVRALAQRFADGARERDLPVMNSTTPIQPLVVGSAESALAASAALEARGFLVTPIRPPTVPDGSARLRVTLSAAHEETQVDALLDALTEVLS